MYAALAGCGVALAVSERGAGCASSSAARGLFPASGELVEMVMQRPAFPGLSGPPHHPLWPL